MRPRSGAAALLAERRAKKCALTIDIQLLQAARALEAPQRRCCVPEGAGLFNVNVGDLFESSLRVVCTSAYPHHDLVTFCAFGAVTLWFCVWGACVGGRVLFRFFFSPLLRRQAWIA